MLFVDYDVVAGKIAMNQDMGCSVKLGYPVFLCKPHLVMALIDRTTRKFFSLRSDDLAINL
ncbi:hypothetical protein CTA1_4021 [Colletotrichum tanaceti]|uniref:Uncharacterized protein n=1 Tax=Colletotrichum tanaceti TaxID=1306861 RepID=A0A4U6X1W0_9PEZI|nr:hypothetical protein CTA1_4021 [Colletotrichum tanaceti]